MLQCPHLTVSEARLGNWKAFPQNTQPGSGAAQWEPRTLTLPCCPPTPAPQEKRGDWLDPKPLGHDWLRGQGPSVPQPRAPAWSPDAPWRLGLSRGRAAASLPSSGALARRPRAWVTAGLGDLSACLDLPGFIHGPAGTWSSEARTRAGLPSVRSGLITSQSRLSFQRGRF